VVPIERSTRSAGQQTYLNAMALGKPVIVTDAPGVRDYIEHEVTGFVVPPETQALNRVIQYVMDPGNAEETAAVGRRAREHVLALFDEYRYRRQLLTIAGVVQAE
jgi:glycosyltransferase involved in cell wall biosynthesis